ncbi:inactive tyrosine-protein kinase PEAK1 [Alosa sapidissima]|uniref:inactive tyrosine-protein kinase PEAK1 n=1 Tax=Alosa sapidissima TaxID=34773 RepID=UPI001C090073|nr:inactive tyrosine-protein kinase PEAK1 [Alosa sapidissima]XP_041964973.1 inactive tyrosine-protein kinase PEAK1 [Alosa sapidissima]XP_041964974.1 inactive tyrosine-protein kinase PEAK1 [Alosa sapidissima]XP_041964975.1 inactive tyrosine-protein kinase PEAK1 [Alosa sapidissima]XP_041964976.1 inactive tyrosine-protein kinase PEAK1 [Alosa sapidissima]XP_041964977.1 inactive tyrosine-protein kinase PEAK1 [Alosa sapidissima]XP_041964978.1 inactive tyrosine-protein kinase PEAK1 [Alosa sapidissim
MSACNTFTEHVWKPGECKNCFKPKSLHRLSEGAPRKGPPERAQTQQSHTPTGATRPNANLANSSQRSGGTARSAQFRPPVAKKPTIAVKPTMMLPCSSTGLDSEGNQRSGDGPGTGKTSAFTVWNRNGLNHQRPGGPNNNEGENGGDEIEGYGPCSPRTPSGNNNNNGLTDVLKEIAGLGSGPSTSSKDDFLGRISSSYRRSLERGLPAAGCLAMGSSSGQAKRVSLSDSAEIISTEGGRFCYPEFSSEGEDDDDEEDEDDDDSDGDDEHESWDESDEELLAMEIRMRGQPRFANFRAATLSPVPFAAGKKWNTVPLRNRSLQRICAVDYDDSYDEILNGYPSMDSNGGPGLLPYGQNDLQGSGFLSNSESTTSPESSSSMPDDSRTSSSTSSVPFGVRNGLHSPAPREALTRSAPAEREPQHRALTSPKANETHKAVLAIRLEDQEAIQREGGALPQAHPGQPITISFSPTEEQAKPYRVVNLEKPPICKPYTVVDVSASMASTEGYAPESTPKPKGLSTPLSPPPYPGSPISLSLSAGSPMSPVSPLSPATPDTPTTPVSPSTANSSAPLSTSRKKPGNIRYQEVWTSSTSPRQKIPRVELVSGGAPGPSVPPRHCTHKSAPTSPIAGLSSSRTVPVKSPNLSEIKFNSYNNAGMPPFPIIIRDEPTYARSSKNAVKVPIVINPSAYDNLAVYKSFLGLSGELPQPKPGAGGRVTSHTYEEIGSSESIQASPDEKSPNSKPTGDKLTAEDVTGGLGTSPKSLDLNCRTTSEHNTTPATTPVSLIPPTSASSPLPGRLPPNSPSCATPGRSREPSGEACKDSNTDTMSSSGTSTGQREKASTVLSQIVASIQPPQSPPESPSAQSKTCSAEELYALPPDATRDTLSRPKSLFSSTDGCLSKPRKETPAKHLPKSQSASAAVAPTSPKAEANPPFPPPRSTSSPYHATNLLQRHFSNWTKPSAGSSRPSDGEISPGVGEGRRPSSESAKPKRWISFKSFFRRRKDEDEQREKVEREKDKGKLVGLDGTVITMLPPPPTQRHHWFAEAKGDDPNQKPTIIFTYKPDSSATGDGEGELRVEECRETASGEATVIRPLSPGQPAPKSRASLLISKVMSQAQMESAESEMPTAASLPAKLELSSVAEACASSARPILASASEGSASLGEQEEEGSHSYSPASSSCSATYSNLGQSRANMIPLKHPRNVKASDDTLASVDPDAPESAVKDTPPPLPKKGTGGRTSAPDAHLTREVMPLRPRAEAKPGGTNLSVANPLYDLDSTWETASQSSSLSSEARGALDHESGDSLERPTIVGKGRPANSLSCLATGAATANSATAGREWRGCRSAESLAGRARTTGRVPASGAGAAASAKPQRQALYKGMDSWEEVVGRIRGLHTDTLRKLAGKCEDRFMAGQKDHVRFGTDSWSHFRLTTGKPCCEAGDAVYYTASYAKDPLVNYAIKICRSKVKETQQQFFHSLAVRQSLPLHFNIQQDCGHFVADVPSRLLPWEEEEEGESEEEEEEEEEEGGKEKESHKKENGPEREKRKEVAEKRSSKEASEASDTVAHNGQEGEAVAATAGPSGKLRSRVVVITREVPFQTVADFVREGRERHTHSPDLYERQVCLLLLQLCSGLEHMKPFHVTHCDLRLENLLLVHCQPGNPWNLDVPNGEPNNNNNAFSAGTGANAGQGALANACPARLIISNFAQAKQKGAALAQHQATAAAADAIRDHSRLAPEIVTATQYRKCDEFQTGILIYEMLHRANPFEESPELKEREYSTADLPPLPVRSLYSQGLQHLAALLLNANPSERIQMAEARACLQCLLWGPREDLFQALSASPGPGHRQATLQNWLDLKRTLMMIKFAERSLDTVCGVSLEDWLCCQYLAFSTPDSLGRVVRILQHQQQALQALHV